MDIFSAPQFRDDEAARAFLESVLWPEGPVCPHCGVVGHAYSTKRAGVRATIKTDFIRSRMNIEIDIAKSSETGEAVGKCLKASPP